MPDELDNAQEAPEAPMSEGTPEVGEDTTEGAEAPQEAIEEATEGEDGLGETSEATA